PEYISALIRVFRKQNRTDFLKELGVLQSAHADDRALCDRKPGGHIKKRVGPLLRPHHVVPHGVCDAEDPDGQQENNRRGQSRRVGCFSRKSLISAVWATASTRS